MSKRPKDPNQLGKLIVDIAVGNIPRDELPKKNPHAVALGRLGGAKGGKARAEKLTDKEKSDIASKAAKARWDKK